MSNLDPTHLDSNFKIEFHINTVNPITLLRIEVWNLTSPQQNQLLSIEYLAQQTRILVSLIKWCQTHRIKSLAFIISTGLDGIVIYANPLVGVSDGDVEVQIVLEIVVGGEIELCQRGISDVEFEVVGANKEPEDDGGDANEDEDSEDQFEN